MATAGGLVFIAATNDSRMRAFESATGKELWVARLDATGNAAPVSYMGRDGKQYVAIAAGGPDHLRTVGDNSDNNGDSIIAFSLNAREVEATEVTSHVAPTGSVATNAVLPPLVMRICGKCHGVATFVQTRLTRQEWRLEVDAMVARGAEGTTDEMRSVVDYLAKNLGR